MQSLYRFVSSLPDINVCWPGASSFKPLALCHAGAGSSVMQLFAGCTEGMLIFVRLLFVIRHEVLIVSDISRHSQTSSSKCPMY